MNKYYVLGGVVLVLGILVLLGNIGLLPIHFYASSPGYTTQEYAQEFYANKPTCYGINILLNEEATYADAPGRSLCIGLLK
jgi:hypothetical protein